MKIFMGEAFWDSGSDDPVIYAVISCVGMCDMSVSSANTVCENYVKHINTWGIE
jgi:hypothetical protein